MTEIRAHDFKGHSNNVRTFLDCSRPALSNTVATSHMWLLVYQFVAILKILKLKITLFSLESWDPYVFNLLEDIIYLKLFDKYLNSHLCVSIFALF